VILYQTLAICNQTYAANLETLWGDCKPAPRAFGHDWALLYPGRGGHCTCVSGAPVALAGASGYLGQKVYGKKWLRQRHLLYLQHLTHLFGQIYYGRFFGGCPGSGYPGRAPLHRSNTPKKVL
jgi:hypothetical protein